jgi:hypothetical protein
MQAKPTSTSRIAQLFKICVSMVYSVYISNCDGSERNSTGSAAIAAAAAADALETVHMLCDVAGALSVGRLNGGAPGTLQMLVPSMYQRCADICPRTDFLWISAKFTDTDRLRIFRLLISTDTDTEIQLSTPRWYLSIVKSNKT